VCETSQSNFQLNLPNQTNPEVENEQEKKKEKDKEKVVSITKKLVVLNFEASCFLCV
jgi:hypothetical protein